jgi:integrase
MKKKNKTSVKADESVRRKEPIHLRQKALANGNFSLFLDKYWKGKRSYEYLQLYLVREVTKRDREQNNSTWMVAESIKAERLLEFQKQAAGIPVYSLDGSFIDYIKILMRARYNSKGNYENWDSALQHIMIFTEGEDVTFKMVTAEWLTRLKNYLANATTLNSDSKKLTPNSQYSYYNKVKAALRQAHEEGFIPANPASQVRGVKQGETHRESLTLEEVQTLISTPCDSTLLKRAFLFSALTGLRFGDVSSIRWVQIQQSSVTGHFIRFSQAKTKQLEYLPISQQARDMLGHAQEPASGIFEGLVYGNSISTMLSRWMARAGILKHITFHCARHTHATLLLNLGIDIYVLSKMLGHKKVSTTEIYARVSPASKVIAANRIPALNLTPLLQMDNYEIEDDNNVIEQDASETWTNIEVVESNS